MAYPSLDQQIEFFARNDYFLFENALTRAEVDTLNKAIDRHREQFPSLWGKGARSQSAQCLLGIPEMDFTIRHPSFFALAKAVLDNDIVFCEHSVMIREGNQKPGVEGWHRDVGVNAKNKYGITALSAIFYTTDVDKTTARYSLIPGSHAVDSKPVPIPPDNIDVEGEREMLAPAGSVILVNAGIWHCGKWGTGPRERRTIHMYYQPSYLPQFSPHTIFPRRLWDVKDAEQRRFYSHFNPLTRTVAADYAMV